MMRCTTWYPHKRNASTRNCTSQTYPGFRVRWDFLPALLFSRRAQGMAFQHLLFHTVFCRPLLNTEAVKLSPTDSVIGRSSQ